MTSMFISAGKGQVGADDSEGLEGLQTCGLAELETCMRTKSGSDRPRHDL